MDGKGSGLEMEAVGGGWAKGRLDNTDGGTEELTSGRYAGVDCVVYRLVEGEVMLVTVDALKLDHQLDRF